MIVQKKMSRSSNKTNREGENSTQTQTAGEGARGRGRAGGGRPSLDLGDLRGGHSGGGGEAAAVQVEQALDHFNLTGGLGVRK